MELRGIYGYWGQHSARNWSRTEIVLKDDTMIMCRGTGQQVVGLKHGNQPHTHCDGEREEVIETENGIHKTGGSRTFLTL